MNVYVEEIDPETEKVVHRVLSNINVRSMLLDLNKRNRYHTIRVWAEYNSGNVRFIKHRYLDPSTTTVDLEEFFWIKLKSQP